MAPAAPRTPVDWQSIGTSAPPLPDTPGELEQRLQRARMTGDPLGEALGLIVRATWEIRKATDRLGNPVPPEALAAGIRELAAGGSKELLAVLKPAAERMARAREAKAGWTRRAAFAVIGAVLLGVGVGIGRFGLPAEVRRVEMCAALALPAGSAWPEIFRMNPNGPRETGRRKVNGDGEVADASYWTRLPKTEGRGR
jgi:hypothetical protein